MRTFGHSQSLCPGSSITRNLIETPTGQRAQCVPAWLQDPDGAGVTKWKRLYSTVASPTAMSLPVGPSRYPYRSTALQENDMTATYTFDVFSSLDGYSSHSGNWGGYWGKQGPELEKWSRVVDGVS
jgi:hypothetical protein